MGFNMCDGPTSPPGKTFLKFFESKDEQNITIDFTCSKTLDELMNEGLSFKEANEEMKFEELSKDWEITAYKGYWSKDPDGKEVYMPMNVYFYNKKYDKCAHIWIDDLEPVSTEQFKSIIESCLEEYNKKLCDLENKEEGK